MNIKRKLIKVQTPPLHQGFLGAGHTARAAIQNDFSETDPFILLMDDMLDKQDGEPAGGPHPHAGFETVSLLLEGRIGDSAHTMQAGDLQIMTAGSGVVHSETMDTEAKLRLLQMWLTLPKKDRWALPRVQDIQLAHVPETSENGVDIKIYSGSLNGVSSPIKNYTPLLIADIKLQPGVTTVQQIPASFNTFLYVIEGDIRVGDEGKTLAQNQVGWLDKFADDTQSDLKITAGDSGSHFVLYAGQPQGDPIVSYGPFIGDTQEDIVRLYKEYREGRMEHISEVPAAQRTLW